MAGGALLAVQAAMAMQGVMSSFASIDAGDRPHALRVKCGVSSGRYFAAHTVAKLDAVAGRTTRFLFRHAHWIAGTR